MTAFLSYWFYPRPPSVSYENPKVLLLALFCILLFFGSFVVSVVRKNRENAVTKKLMKSWAPFMRWFGGIGMVLLIARAEDIQFLSIRAFWALWVFLVLGFTFLQIWRFRVKHYTIVPKTYVEDPREKYLPKQK